jgi:hypothetical protein
MSIKKVKWSDENEVFLLKLITDNMDITKISKKIKKTEKEIIYKLKKIANKMLNNNKSKDEIMKTLKILNEEQIDKIINKYNKKILKKQNDNTSISEISFMKTSKNKHTENTEYQQIFNILNEMNTKIDLLLKKNNISTKNNITSKNNITTKNNITSKNNIEIVKNENNETSSFISSGSDTDVMNLIKTRTEEVIAKRNQFFNSKQKK